MTARGWWLVATTLGACVDRAEAPHADLAQCAQPPFVAWLEPDPDHASVTVVVMPRRSLGAPIALTIEGRRPRTAWLGENGGRLRVAFAPGESAVRVSAEWRDVGGVAGARAVLDLGAPQTDAAAFVPIHPLWMGTHGPSIDAAIRLR